MKVLVVGSGGREHAVVDALSHSPGVRRLFAAPGNGGIASQADIVPIAADAIPELLQFARTESVDLTFVGPEVPLSLGIVDAFRERGLRVIGPTAEHAQLEASKIYAKRFFKAHGIPTADFKECSNAAEAYKALEGAEYPVVVKADGLAAGKGVVVAESAEEARRAVHDFVEARSMGKAGERLVIEEFMEGYEASFFVLADGTDFHPTVVAQDHKRRFDGDRGPNTGGMGAYSVDSILDPAQHSAVLEQIVKPTLVAAKTYTGILFVGLMLTPEGPKVVEYNARFGDPETQVVLPRLKTDLLELFLAMTEHRLGSTPVEWREGAAATVVLVADGYPGPVRNGKEVAGLERAGGVDGVKIYHAGTRVENGRIYTAGGRVLNVTAVGSTLQQALDRAYRAAEMVEFDGKDYRRDIGRKGIAKIL